MGCLLTAHADNAGGDMILGPRVRHLPFSPREECSGPETSLLLYLSLCKDLEVDTLITIS